MAWYAVPELLGLAELPAWPSMFVMPCSPPLTPPSQRGSGLARVDHSLACTKNTRLETVPRARSTVSFHHPPTLAVCRVMEINQKPQRFRWCPPAHSVRVDRVLARLDDVSYSGGLLRLALASSLAHDKQRKRGRAHHEQDHRGGFGDRVENDNPCLVDDISVCVVHLCALKVTDTTGAWTDRLVKMMKSPT